MGDKEKRRKVKKGVDFLSEMSYNLIVSERTNNQEANMAKITINVPDDFTFHVGGSCNKTINLAKYLEKLTNEQLVRTVKKGVYDVEFRKARNASQKDSLKKALKRIAELEADQG